MTTLTEALANAGTPESAASKGLPEWAQKLRSRGHTQFSHHGLPHRRLEAWKYTPLDGLNEAVGGLGIPGSASGDEALLDIEADLRLIFTDGALQDTPTGLPAGVEVLSLPDALSTDDGSLQAALETLDAEQPTDAMLALNTATLAQGALIRVAPGVDAGSMVAEWRNGRSESPALFNSRVIIQLGEGASLDWIEHQCLDQVLNLVTQVTLDTGSSLTHARLQDNKQGAWLISRMEVAQAADSRFEQASIDLGAGLARYDLGVGLAGSGAACKLLGAYLTDGTAHVDHHLDVRHEATACRSDQTFRGVLHGKSRAVFSGRVHVLPGADDSEAHQSNANLLLSRDAEVDTKPELIIEADEVVASHGATVGQLDDTAVFYLRSRGIDAGDARRMLTGAFCRSVVEAMSSESAREAFTIRLNEALERKV